MLALLLLVNPKCGSALRIQWIIWMELMDSFTISHKWDSVGKLGYLSLETWETFPWNKFIPFILAIGRVKYLLSFF